VRKLRIAALLVLAVVLIAGCGRTGRTYRTPGGSVTVKTEKSPGGDKGTVEVKTEEGSATMTTDTKETISEAELGVPVYPGATVRASGKYEGKNGASGTAAVENYTLMTGDSFEQVNAFYKSHLKNVRTSFGGSQAGGQTAMFAVGPDDAPITISISRGKDDKETTIGVMKSHK